tara:strand:+ start:1999 stop:3315 length:1317 start_codon:yes stop_codon:yes gene_type:complete
MSNLVTYKLGDICNVTDYVANGSFAALNENVEYLDTKDYAVMIRLVDYNSNWKSSLLYTTKKSYEFLKKSSLNPGDVVIANVGANAGTIFRVPNLGMPMTLAPNAVACFPKELDILDRDFLYYYFLSSNGQWSISTILGGSAQPKFNKTDFRSLELSVPAIDDQKAISHILGTLDEKIELNKNTIETLEKISKALFKSWFIDFDPVRAKEEGRSTGLSYEMSDLFPNSFEDSEIGEIPKDWKIKSLDEIATYLNGLALQKFPSKGDASDLPVIKIAQLRKGNSKDSDKCSSNIAEKYIISDGDILFSWSGSLLVDIWTGGVGALNQHLFKVTSDIYKKWFILHWTKFHLQEFQRIAKSKATTMGHIQRKNLSEAKIILPPKELMKEITAIFEPLLEREINARLESKFLFQLRDSILPKLISGEIRIPDAQKLVEELGI